MTVRSGPPGGTRAAHLRTAAPLGRLVRSELLLVVPRPRTAVTLATLVLVPVLVAFALRAAGGDGTVLGVARVTVNEFTAFVLGVPVALVAADAFASERSLRTLDQLRLAPVGPGRLVLLKATGVAAVAGLTAIVTIVVALLAGLLLLPVGPLGLGATLTREAVIGMWLAGQLAGYGVLLLPVSLLARPTTAAVIAVTAGLVPTMVGTLVPSIPAWVDTMTPSGNWLAALQGISAVPADASLLGATTLRAVLYAVAGAAATVWLLSRRAT